MIHCAAWCGISAAFHQLGRVQAKAAPSISLQAAIFLVDGTAKGFGTLLTTRKLCSLRKEGACY